MALVTNVVTTDIVKVLVGDTNGRDLLKTIISTYKDIIVINDSAEVNRALALCL